MSAQMSREDFIAAMIGELERQKTAQGNVDGFFTGGFLSASDVFRKLCFDFPLVDDQALQILLVGFKTVRKSAKPHEFRRAMHMHPVFLSNLFSLAEETLSLTHTHTHSQEDLDSDEEDAVKLNIHEEARKSLAVAATSVSSKRSAVVSQLHCEVFLHLPPLLCAMSKGEIAARLSPAASDTSWINLLALLRDHVVRSSATAIAQGVDCETLSSEGSVDALLSFIESLQRVLDSSKQSTERAAQSETALRHSEHLSLMQWLETQTKMIENRRQSRSTDKEKEQERDEEDLLAEQLLAMVSEMFSHSVRLAVDLCCRHNDLLCSHFPRLLNTLLQKEKESNALVAADDIFFRSAKQSVSVSTPLPTPSQYLALMALSRVSHHFTSEDERGRGGDLSLRQARAALRASLLESDVLQTLHELCDRIAKHNKHHQQQDRTGTNALSTQASQRVIDLESAKMVADIADLVLFSDTLSSSPAPSLSLAPQMVLTQKLLSSRLLASLVTLYRNVLFAYSQQPLLSSPESSVAVPQEGSVQTWQLGGRLTRALCCAALLDVQLASFIADFPEVFTALSALLSPSARRSFSLWCPAWSVPLVFAAGLTLNSKNLSLQPLLSQCVQWLVAVTAEMDFSSSSKEEDESNDDLRGEQTPSSRRTAEQTARRQDAVRLLEAIVSISRWLSTNEIRDGLSRIDIDPKRTAGRNELYRSLRNSLSAVYRTINVARGNAGDASSIGYLDKATKRLKSILSLLEGDASSKAD